MTAIRAMGVVIPARNEEQTVRSCIHSVRQALLGLDLSSWIVVVADDCDDRTAEYAGFALGKAGEVLRCAERSAGASRRLGAQRILARWTAWEPRQVWLANTDADTEVPRDWIAQQLRYATRGVCGLAGIVRIECDNPHLTDNFCRHYQLGSDGAHRHVHGANLGVRMDAYLDAGGWPTLDLGEDVTLWRRLGQRGWHRRSVTTSIVKTSARLQGRASGGFADVLRRLNATAPQAAGA